MTDNVALYGTDQPPVSRQAYRCGPWGLTLEGGALRHITLNGTEAIRGIAFLVRDRDWGTLTPVITNETVEQSEAALQLSYNAAFSSQGARLDVTVRLEVSACGLKISASGHASGIFETNRAGFTVLHPITDVAGQPVQVTHSDGQIEDSQFPSLIAPWQPFMDIVDLTHQVGDRTLSCAFHGDIFEMEDQRQWGDASFKTYNRPLALPWPYRIADGVALKQAVELTWTAAKLRPSASPTAHSKPRAKARLEQPKITGVFPEMALVLTPQDARRLAASPSDIMVVNPQRLLCHLDATLGETQAQFASFAAAQAACPDHAYDLELICRCPCDPAEELQSLAVEMRDSGFVPASILICPSVDRQSTPPGSDWPACPPLEQVHAAAAQAFPQVRRGGGMVSFFPELNRKRPPVAMLSFTSHGLCPIVHAADDLSVMETLEALPHITRSARAIIGETEYRIGPATIAMRQNPYGAQTIANPQHQRLCMAHDDPRQRAKFAAAYAIGLATALAPAGISVWTPAALYGPRGVMADQGQWPVARALKLLAERAGEPIHQAQIEAGTARLCLGAHSITANLTADPLAVSDGADLAPYDWAVRRRQT